MYGRPGLALIVLVSCGGGNGDEVPDPNPEPTNNLCDNVECPEHARCDRSSADPICVCAVGYEGENCLPIPPEPPRAMCEVGFQDNDGDMVCREACVGSGFGCFRDQICDDQSGEAICTCPPRTAGAECDQCERGYRAIAESPLGGPSCVATCDLQPGICNDQICSDLGREAACLCRLGFEPTHCSTCAAGLASDGRGNCAATQFPAPDPSLLLTSVRVRYGDIAVGFIDLASHEFTPLVWTRAAFTALAHAAPDRIYLLLYQELAELNLRDGSTTPLLALETPGAAEYRAMVWDPARARLVLLRTYSSISTGGNTLLFFDPATNATEEVDLPFIQQPMALAHDAATGRILVLTESAIWSTDSDGADARMFVSHPAPLIYVSGAVFLGDNFVYLQPALSPREWLASKCRLFARMVGVDPERANTDARYEITTSAGAIAIEGGDPTIHAFSSATGDPLEVTVDTRHPDAIVCIITERRPLHVVVRATARFRHLYLAERDRALTLDIESAFPAPVENYRPLVVHSRSNNGSDPSLNMRSELASFLEPADADRLGLGSYSPGPESGGGTLLVVPSTGDAAGAQQNLSLDFDFPLVGLSRISP